MHKFSKDIGDVSWFHENLLGDDAEILDRQLQVENAYSQGPVRSACLLCNSILEGLQGFERGQISFVVCEVCGHVNGSHIITEEFVASTYTAKEAVEPESCLYGEEFTSGKMADEFSEVVERIYVPKAEFLRDYLVSRGITASETSVLDAGCGSGHFLSALLKSGFHSSRGFDSFEPAVRAAESIGGFSKSQVSLTAPGDLLEILRTSDSDVVSMMCVLVHLESPIAAMRAMADNPSIRFSFQKIPMWSFATILEAAFPSFRARVLGADHTNVFTFDSLRWLEEELGVSRVASWSFGGDSLDLQRKVLIAMGREGASAPLVERASRELSSVANGFQQVIDEKGMASEIHLVWEFH